MKLVGAVTIYHPEENVKDNINSYLDELDLLYVLDNTEQPNPEIKNYFSQFSKIKYIAFGDNMGISYAFNFVLNEVKDYDFLLTMDQDSSFPIGVMEKYHNLVETYEQTNPKKTAMYSVKYISDEQQDINKPRSVNIAITSGSILPVQLANELGGFDEKLFIDEVDSEYCYRAKKDGFDIIEFPNIILNHSLGMRTFHSVGQFKFNTLNHNAMRKYYITRNKIYVLKKYPFVKWSYLKEIIKMSLKVILVEDDKIKKFKYIIRGCKDGINNHMGKLKA